MMKRRTKKILYRPHYAWIIMLCCLVLSGAGSGVFVSTLGVFVKPICEDLGFLRSQFILYSTIYFIVNVLLMPIYGTLFQRFSFRKIAAICSVACSVSLLGYSFSHELWHFYLFALISGLFVNGISIMAMGILINRWFIDKRGLACGIAYSGTGITAAILLPICNQLIGSIGWSMTFRFLAVIELLITLPIVLFMIRDKPEDMGVEAYRKSNSSGEEEKSSVLNGDNGLTRKQAMSTPTFWLLFIAVFIIAVCQAGPNSNTVSILSDIGYSSAFAASVSSAYMIILTICKVGMGHIFDRLGSMKGSMLIGVCCIIFPLVALFNYISFVPWIYVAVLAVAGSGSTVLGTVLSLNYFGRKDYARVYSLIALGTQLGAAFSSPFLGIIYDMTGGYNLAWYLICGMAVIICICLIMANKTSKKLKL